MNHFSTSIKPLVRSRCPLSQISPRGSPKRKLNTSALRFNNSFGSGSNSALRTGAAAAALCSVYVFDQSLSRDDSRVARTEASLLSNSKLNLVNDLAQEAKRSLLQRCATTTVKPVNGNHISLQGVDFRKLTPSRARKIIDALHSGKVLDAKSLVALSEAATGAFKSEATMLDLSKSGNSITVVGDVHGSLPCLKRVMELVGKLENGGVMVVAGDYVDRGEHSLEVFCTFLLLKLAYPNNVYMLRGNHEDNEICSEYGFLDELREKYGYKTDDGGIWEALSDVFASLPLAAKTETSVILHGGLPSGDFKLSDLDEIDSETRFSFKTLTEARTPKEKLIEGILWSDPVAHNGIAPNERGYGIEFGPDIAKDFLDRHGLKYIIRAHEHVETGSQVLECGEGKGVVTVFSTANYPYGEGTNSGAVLKLNQQSKFESIPFTYSESTIMEAFRYLDVQGKGYIGRDEFLARIEEANENLPSHRRLMDAEEFFEMLDQGKGEVDVASFTRYFQSVA